MKNHILAAYTSEYGAKQETDKKTDAVLLPSGLQARVLPVDSGLRDSEPS